MLGWVILGILVLLILFGIGMYNGLVRLKVQCDNAWADIDVQLKRRYDLIPNLVETVKGYAAHEKGTLEDVINARNRAMSATGPADKAQAENMLSGALKSLFALSEAYPQLRAIESFSGGDEGQISGNGFANAFHVVFFQPFEGHITGFVFSGVGHAGYL